MTTGTVIKRYRTERGWSQRKLASLIGVTHPAITQWEGGQRHPRRRYIERLAAVFGVNERDLEDESGEAIADLAA